MMRPKKPRFLGFSFSVAVGSGMVAEASGVSRSLWIAGGIEEGPARSAVQGWRCAQPGMQHFLKAMHRKCGPAEFIQEVFRLRARAVRRGQLPAVRINFEPVYTGRDGGATVLLYSGN